MLYLKADAISFSIQLCNHIASGKKCQYVGNCSFAHSPEERDVWTYMKENGSKLMINRGLDIGPIRLPCGFLSSL